MLNGVPEMEQYRRYFGRALTPATIEQVLVSANLGFMRDLTDLSNETLFIDTHYAGATGKRFRSLASAKITVVPAKGDGIDEPRATRYADMVRQQLAWIPNLKQSILRLNWGHLHGRAALEKVWRENPAGNVRWRVDRLNWIQPRRLSFGPQRELRVRDGVFDGTGFSPVGLDLAEVPLKFICFTPQLFNETPEREGFGPRCLYWSFHKRFSWRERMVLLEVFGKPWRIAYTDNPAVQPDALDRAGEVIDGMGGSSTAVMPPGVKVETSVPGDRSGQNHRDAGMDADDQISKLVLGTTRTTDAKPGALGSTGDEVGQEEQGSVVEADGWNLSDLLTEQLAADIIVLNEGPEYLDHCPRIEIRYELPRNRGVEADVATKTLALGLPLVEDEVYERTGWTKPGPTDRVIKQPPQAAPELPGSPSPNAQDPGSPSPSDNSSGGGGGSPLGQGGQATGDPSTLRGGAHDPLVLARAARLLDLLSRSSGSS